ncbi:hypothetical protein DFH09DRAFT_1147925 [Mycena vulgaris]|nr:hypothetical protein DFH09DRAFT_1147925 [Mycena vulgaris]
MDLHTLRLGVCLPPCTLASFCIHSSALASIRHPLSRPHKSSPKSYRSQIGASSQARTPGSLNVWLTPQGEIPAMSFHFRHD